MLLVLEKSVYKKYYDKKEKEFIDLTKKELKKMLTPEYKKQIRAAIDEAFEEGWLDPEDRYDKPYYKTNKIPKLSASNPYGDYIVIMDDETQEMREVCHFICCDIANIMEKLTGYVIDTGDGDEGCIYPDFLYDLLAFYDEWKETQAPKEEN